jgi:hypothetical protein
VGDLPKPSESGTWTDVEQSFFAAAPPEEPQPPAEPPRFDDLPAPPPRRPRRAILARLRPSVAAAGRRATLAIGAAGGHMQRAWRETALVVRAAGVNAWHAAGAGAAGLIHALSLGPVARRRVGLTLAGASLAAGIAAGGIAVRKGVLARAAEIAEKEPAVSGPTVAAVAPVAISASPAVPRPTVRSSADVRAPRADVAKRPPRAPRRPVVASSSTQRPQVTATAFEDRETYWARGARPAPDRASRPLFSR